MDKILRETANLRVEIMNSKQQVKRKLGHVAQIRLNRLTQTRCFITLNSGKKNNQVPVISLAVRSQLSRNNDLSDLVFVLKLKKFPWLRWHLYLQEIVQPYSPTATLTRLSICYSDYTHNPLSPRDTKGDTFSAFIIHKPLYVEQFSWRGSHCWKRHDIRYLYITNTGTLLAVSLWCPH